TSKFGIPGQLAVLPTGKTLERADPEGPVTRGEQTSNPAIGKLFIPGRMPGNTPNAIETQQAELRAQPEVTVRRLRNGRDLPWCKPLAEYPRLVCVLIDVKARVQRGRSRGTHQREPQRDHAWRDHCPVECVRPLQRRVPASGWNADLKTGIAP